MSSTWEHLELESTTFFTADPLPRIVGERSLFYLGEECWWTLLHVVTTSLVAMMAASSARGFTALCMLRFLRMLSSSGGSAASRTSGPCS